MRKRIISLLLVLAMLVSVFPAVAANETAPDPKFTSFYLTLNESIAINFKAVDLSSGNFDRVEFWKDGALSQTVTKLPAQANGGYAFRFTNLSPDELGKKITVKLFVKGSSEPVHTIEKSVKDYCEIVMNGASYNADIKAVVVDLLNYGAAFQVYKGADPESEDLVNFDLTPTQKAYGTQETPKLESITSAGDQSGYDVKWYSFGLTLKEVVRVYFNIKAESMEGLTLKMTAAGKSWDITEFEYDAENDLYRANFDKLNPVQMSEVITAQIFAGDEAVTTVLTTSIESYAANATDEKVKAVVAEMMKYGGATKTWVEGEDDDTVVTATNAIYVASTAKAGEGDGTIDKPLASIQEARDMIRKIKLNGEYPEGGITVYFREGKYFVTETAYLNEADSGEEGAPVIYTAYNGEKVEFVGGVSVDASDFQPVTDEAILARLAYPENTKQLDLKALGIYDYGQMHVYGHGAAYFEIVGIPIPTTPPPELFFDDQVMSVAKYPDVGWLKIGAVIDTGDVIQNWTEHGPAADFIPEDQRPPFDEIRGSVYTVYQSVRNRMERWTEASDIWVYGFWKETWSDQSMPVGSIDPASGIVKTSVPSGKPMASGREFYFYNLLEEITVPGEYYMDRDSGILYAYLPGDTGTVTYGALEGPVIMINSGCHDVQIVGIDFTGGCTTGIEVEGAKNIVIRDSELSKFADIAIALRNSRDVLVTGCHIFETGAGGIGTGYSDEVDPWKTAYVTLESLNVVVENCEIHDYSRLAATYAPAVSTAGAGMIVRNCKIYNADHYAIALGGNDTIIENCEIFNVLRTVSDSGAIYMGMAKEVMGQVVRNNFFHDIGSTQGDDVSVIYMDDTHDGVTFESNILVNIGGRGALVNGGWDNTVSNNIMINVNTEAGLGCIGLNHDINGPRYEHYFEIYNAGYEAYKKYPHWEEKAEALLKSNTPKYNVIDNNVLVNVKKVAYATSGAGWTVEDSLAVNTVNAGIKYNLDDIGFVNYANGDFNLTDDSAVKALLGDKAPDFSKMGLFDKGCEKPKDFGGSGYEDEEEEAPPVGDGSDSDTVPTGIMYREDFSTEYALGFWSHVSAQPAGITTELNDGALEVTLGGNGTINYDTYFEYAFPGKVSYEMDYSMTLNDCIDIDPGIFIVRGKNSNRESKSIVNPKLFIDKTTGAMTFGAYDGSGDTRSSVACEDGKTYRIKVICDPATDTYDFYVDDQPAIIGGRMRGDAGDVVSFDGIRITTKKNSGDTVAVARYDNILVTGLEICDEEVEPSNVLLEEGFETTAGIDNLGEGWTTEINEAGQLQITTTATNQVSPSLAVAEHAADATVTAEWEIIENIGESRFHGDVILAGTKAALNIWVSGGYFMIADGGEGEATATQSISTNVQCVDGQLYKFMAVLDFATSTYSLYIDGNLITEGRSLRPGADKLSKFTLDMKENTEGKTASVCYDNIKVYLGDGSENLEKPREILFSDDFTTDTWTHNFGAGWTVGINENGQMQITTTATNYKLMEKPVAEHAADATVTVEWEVAQTLNGSKFHGDVALWGSKAALNIWVKNGYFMISDGGEGEATATQSISTDVQCVDGQLYKFMAVLDFATKTYSLYIDGDLITEGRSLRPGADKLSSFMIELKENTEGMTASVCYDNILVYETVK